MRRPPRVAFAFSEALNVLTLESPFVAALNHLLEAEPWARERLAPHAGAELELRAPPLPALRFAIQPDGRLAPSAAGAPPSLLVTLKPEALAQLVRHGTAGEDYLARAVSIEGDTRLAAEVMTLLRHLRWDAEEDLSKVVGDAAAHRLAGTARDFLAWQADAARRLAASFMDYAVEERRLLVPQSELAALADANARLRDDLERLEKRVERLAAARSH